MRMFIAVELPARALEVAADVSCAWRHHVSSIAPAAKLAWVPVERIHLTLRFLGNVTLSAATALVPALDGLETVAFDLSLGAPGAFPARPVCAFCTPPCTGPRHRRLKSGLAAPNRRMS